MTRHLPHTSSQKGFTLVEMVLVVLIFSIAITVAVDIFVRAQRAQRRSTSMQELQSDMRLASGTLAGKVRIGAVDYAAYAAWSAGEPSAGGSEVLAIKDGEGRSIMVKKSSSSDLFCGGSAISATGQTPSQAICPDASRACLVIKQDGVCASLTSTSVTMDLARFYITPLTEEAEEQGKVRIVLSGTNTIRGTADTATMSLQTTVSMRQFTR